MKATLILSIAAFGTLPAWAADPAEELHDAAQKLAAQPNYSWAAKAESPQGNQQNAQGQPGRGRGFGGGGPSSGMTEKDGFTFFTFTMGDTTTEAVRKGDKVAVKSEDEWKTSSELTAEGGGTGGGFNRQRFLARRVEQTRLPAAEVEELIGRVKGLKKDADVYSG